MHGSLTQEGARPLLPLLKGLLMSPSCCVSRVLGYVEANRRLLEVQGFDPVQLPFFEVRARKGTMQELLRDMLERSLCS